MSFSVAIVGLPNAGKSTLFKALTKKKVDIASYPFTTIDPNVGVVPVPDKRLEKISSLVQPEKTVETVIGFTDIAGLVKNAHQGEGLGNQFLNHIRACDAIVEVVRNFEDSNVEHVEGKVDPEEDIKTIETELLMKDLETIEGIKEKSETLEKIKNHLLKNKPIRELNLKKEEELKIKEYQLLTAKPKIYLYNISEKQQNINSKNLTIDLKLEEEASELSRSEAEELNINSQLDQLITTCYNILDLITFFTIKGGKEARAWTLKKGSTAFEAAEKVHTDFKEKFVRAEVISHSELVQSGSWLKAKESGKVKTVGRDYIVQDGEIIEFRI